jgi:hypothetical protein
MDICRSGERVRLVIYNGGFLIYQQEIQLKMTRGPTGLIFRTVVA